MSLATRRAWVRTNPLKFTVLFGGAIVLCIEFGIAIACHGKCSTIAFASPVVGGVLAMPLLRWLVSTGFSERRLNRFDRTK